MASVEITERDLRRDEARLLSILTGGPANPEAELPEAAPRRRPRVPAWAAALVLTGCAAAVGVGLRALVEPLLRPAPTRQPTNVTARLIPPVAPTTDPPARSTPPAVTAPPVAAPVPVTTVAPPAPIPTPTEAETPSATQARLALHVHPRTALTQLRDDPEAAPSSAEPPHPAASRWIAEPLYGEALRRAREVDAWKAAQLNQEELARISAETPKP